VPPGRGAVLATRNGATASSSRSSEGPLGFKSDTFRNPSPGDVVANSRIARVPGDEIQKDLIYHRDWHRPALQIEGAIRPGRRRESVWRVGDPERPISGSRTRSEPRGVGIGTGLPIAVG
jgi:hypothetical protein